MLRKLTPVQRQRLSSTLFRPTVTNSSTSSYLVRFVFIARSNDLNLTVLMQHDLQTGTISTERQEHPGDPQSPVATPDVDIGVAQTTEEFLVGVSGEAY